MKFIIVGVEGEASEVAGISGALTALRQQSPRGYKKLEVVLLPLGGNHGHGRTLINKFSEEVTRYISNPDNCVEKSDKIEKRLVCDYDKMEDHGIDEVSFRKKISAIGALPIISKPCFEYFSARMLLSKDELDHLLDTRHHINDALGIGIRHYNESQNIDLLRLKQYSKNKHAAQLWFGKLFSLDPSFLERAKHMKVDINSKYYTEIPKLIQEIAENFEE